MGGTVSTNAEDDQAPIRGNVYGKFFDDIESGNLQDVKIAVEYTQIEINNKDVKGRPAIFVAAEHNKLAIVQYLLSVEGIDVNAASNEGKMTPVHIAAVKGHRDIVQLLLLHGAHPLDADVDFRYGASIGDLALVKQAVMEKHVAINEMKDGKSVLYLSAEAGHAEVVDYLAGLEGIDLNKKNGSIRSPIGQAAFHGHDAVVACLLKHGATPLDPVSELLFASKNGNLAVVQQVLQVSISTPDLINSSWETDRTAVYWAATSGHVAVLEYLLGMGAKAILPDLLIAAAGDGRVAVVDYLLKHHDVDVNHTDKNDSTALFLACRQGHADVVTCLLSRGAKVLRSDKRVGCLMAAAGGGHSGVVDILLQQQQREDVNICENDDGQFALWAASEKGHASVVQSLIKNNANVNQVTKLGQSSLWIASCNGHAATVDCLLTNGADANQVSAFDGSMPLCAAVDNGHLDCAEKLVRHGAKVNESNKDGRSTLHQAAYKGHFPCVAFLVKEGANVNQKASFTGGDGPLMAAASQGHVKIVNFLLKHNATVNDKDDSDRTALYLSAGRGHLAVVQALVGQGASVNMRCKDGRTALVMSAEKGHVDIIKFLVANGAEPELAGKTGDTPLHAAGQHGMVAAFVYLFTLGASYTTRNENGKTCFDLLASENKLKVLAELELSLSLLEAHEYALWFILVQEDGILARSTSNSDDPGSHNVSALFDTLATKVKESVSAHPALATAKDVNNRMAMDVASKTMKAIIQSVLLWHGRYRMVESRPDHISATCYVFKGVDEQTLDVETGQPIKVALKLMRLKEQFQREVSTRDKGFNQEHVMHILQTHPEVGSLTMNSWPDEVVDVEADATGQLTKTDAEKLYLLVMPLADRNLFVALKQERWAGKNMEEVRHVFVQLVHCIEHMHEKGVLHADIKTLNVVRTAGQWKLIDLDAACEIGKAPVGHKSSSAYVPPESIYVDEKSASACVRSVVAVTKGGANYDLLTAHPSFDVWSLGCILYQMCNPDVKPLFQGGQDDNLVGFRKGVDNLFALAEWSPELKADKLSDVLDKSARNLLSQMLHKDPLQRPSLARVLAHPFLSGKKVARLVGEKPKYDVFLSYRVASDSQHVEKLYNLLTSQGFKVYWDKLCLEPGVDWEQGFCEGLVCSRAFVPLLSRDAINHPDKDWQNFSKLTADSNCDNVFLEHRLAVELHGIGMIEKMFPVFIGDLDATTSEYSHYFGSGCNPMLSELTVKSVEDKLRHHMESQALGTPLEPDRTVKSVVGAITTCQGAFIVGPADATFAAAAASIAKMLTDVPAAQSPRGGTHVLKALLDVKDSTILVAENSTLKSEVGTLAMENSTLKGKVNDALVSLNSGEFASVEALIAHMRGLLNR